MKKIYQTPDIKVIMFSLSSDILDSSNGTPDPETSLPMFPGEDLDSSTNSYSVKDYIGFGW